MAIGKLARRDHDVVLASISWRSRARHCALGFFDQPIFVPMNEVADAEEFSERTGKKQRRRRPSEEVTPEPERSRPKDGTRTGALAKFNKGEGGFKDRDLYVFCFDVNNSKFTAHGANQAS